MITQSISTQDDWVARAVLCEFLAKSLQLPTRELAGALVTGEFQAALSEVGRKTALDPAVLSQATPLLAE